MSTTAAAEDSNRSRRHSMPLPLLASRRLSSDELSLHSPKDEKQWSPAETSAAFANQIDLPTLAKDGLTGVRRVDKRNRRGVVGKRESLPAPAASASPPAPAPPPPRRSLHSTHARVSFDQRREQRARTRRENSASPPPPSSSPPPPTPDDVTPARRSRTRRHSVDIVVGPSDRARPGSGRLRASARAVAVVVEFFTGSTSRRERT